jgi:hypothetical protein
MVAATVVLMVVVALSLSVRRSAWSKAGRTVICPQTGESADIEVKTSPRSTWDFLLTSTPESQEQVTCCSLLGNGPVSCQQRCIRTGEPVEAVVAPRSHEAPAPPPGDHPFVSYPLHYLAGVFTSEKALEVLLELESAGFARNRFHGYEGPRGAAELDAAQQGLLARMIRAVQQLTPERDFLTDYLDAVRSGQVVLAVHIEESGQAKQDTKNRVLELFKEHGAESIHYFGGLQIETYSLARR